MQCGHMNGGHVALMLVDVVALQGVCKYLLQAKAAVNLPRPNGSTPLWIASAVNHVPIVELLLEAKADVTARGWNVSSTLCCSRAIVPSCSR